MRSSLSLASDFGSDGKLVRPRRQASSRTLYDRPEPRPTAASPNEKCNWLLAAGRVLVNGAGKLLSSVISSDTSSSWIDWGSVMAKNNIGLEELRLKRMVVTDDCLEMISTAGLIGGSLSDVLVFLRPDPFYFRFDRLGVRVPTLLISPWIEKGTVIHKPAGPTPSSQFEHSSIPMKVKRLFNL